MKVLFITRLRKSKAAKILMAYAGLSFLAEICFPTVAWALTSGPAQEEFASFEPVSTSDMVDLNSGDFTYNLPLLSVPGPNGGYPINLAYHSGVGMDQEASWVGLGWNVNVGAINRSLRGLPDDFKGDNVKQTFHIKPTWNVGIAANFSKSKSKQEELFGFPFSEQAFSSTSGISTSTTWQLYYNNYKGLGYRIFVNMVPKATRERLLTPSVGLSFDSQNGIGMDPSLSLGLPGIYKGVGMDFSIGASYNSRQGLKDFSFSSGFSLSRNVALTKKAESAYGSFYSSTLAKGLASKGSSVSFSFDQSVPSASIPTKSTTYQYDVKIGIGNGVTGTGIAGSSPGYFEAHFPGVWSGFYAKTEIEDGGIVNSPAYGFLYTDAAEGKEDAMRDFQREGIEYSKKIPNLAPSSMTYDLYMQSGQGTGSMFRPYYSSIGRITDPVRENIDEVKRRNLEIGVPTVLPQNLHLGLAWPTTHGSHRSGDWLKIGSSSDHDLFNLSFAKLADPGYENAYFQVYGEKTGFMVYDDQLGSWKGDEALRVEIEKDNDADWLNRQFKAKNSFVTSATDNSPVQATGSNVFKHKRSKRGSNIYQFSDSESQAYGLTDFIGYIISSGVWTKKPKAYSATASYIKGHHVSEISVLQPDGMRYVYGLPAYNKKQLDASFSVDPSPSNFNSPLVQVPNNGSVIEPPSNNMGDQEFLSQTELDPYVHSWMLTAVVSADFIDKTGNGPSNDDYGYWVKFNYSKSSDSYRWRVPYSQSSFIEGTKNNNVDDKGALTYGEKELYYLQSIETKTHIAVFELSKREDAIAAADLLNGNRPSTITDDQRMYRLDKISLFSKKEYFADPNAPTLTVKPSPVAIKSVNFRYSYDLCPYSPNNTQQPVMEPVNHHLTNVNSQFGKLTLEKVFFTYQNSTRGELSPYEFKYGDKTPDSPDNPRYNNRNIDRWGNFKPNSSIYSGSNNKYPYVDFPYTNQDGGAPNVAAWSLKQIELPSGGIINVEYESDDYAYVESKKATRMFDIAGLGEICPPHPSTAAIECIAASNAVGLQAAASRNNTTIFTAFNESVVTGSGKDNDYRVYFKLEDPIQYGTPNPNGIIIQKYLNNGGLNKVYFRVYADLLNTIPGVLDYWGTGKTYDYVSGYADIDLNYVGVAQSGSANSDYDYGYITLKPEPLNNVNYSGVKVSPFTKAAIQHLRVNRSELVHSVIPVGSDPTSQFVNFLGGVLVNMNDIVTAMMGFNLWSYTTGYGQKIQLNGRSIIRLCDPNGTKYGGGVRVNRLALDDNWLNTNQTVDEFEYGQQYDYTTIDGSGNPISSGVAYEPKIGGEESALRNPIEYKYSTPLASAYNLFLETPILENHYPGPTVSYSKVTVKSISSAKAAADGVSIAKTKAPVSVYEFYTAKDFPILQDETDMNSDKAIIRPILIPGVFSSFKKRKARSQGYSIVLNDMNGKLKSLTQQTEAGKILSQQKYIYNTIDPYDPNKVNKLSSKVQVLNSDATTYQTAIIGQSHDMYVEMNENIQKSKGKGLDWNLDVWSYPIYAMIVPMFNITKTEVSMRTIVTNKVIYRTGILKEIISTIDESVIKTENVAYDIETGEPLLTKVTNEFRDPIYNYSYPAKWFYPNMGGAYQNQGVAFLSKPGNFLGVSNSSGRIDLTTHLPAGRVATDYFTVGDEVYMDFVGIPADGIYTVANVVSSLGFNYINCINKQGAYAPQTNYPISYISQINVVRSGYRNLLTSKAGSLASRNINVIAYDPAVANTEKLTPHPYVKNEILDASAIEFSDVWQTDCNDCPDDDNSPEAGVKVNPWGIGIRGIWRPKRSWGYITERHKFNDTRTEGVFTDFAEFPWTNPASHSAKWVDAATMTKVSPEGFELESIDAIDQFSSSLYGYNNSLMTAMGQNSRYKELAFDGFEDYPGAFCSANSNYTFGHFVFTNGAAQVQNGIINQIVNTQSHTGKNSVQVSYNGMPVFVTRNLDLNSNNCDSIFVETRTIPPVSPPDYEEYITDECDCIGKFSPIPDKTYVLSIWVKEIPQGHVAPVNTLLTYTSPEVKVEFFNGGNPTSDIGYPNTYTYSANANTPIIEGWQRIFETFRVPPSTTSIKVTLLNDPSNSVPAAQSDVYFDDIRIHPFDGNMVSYVYDNTSLKLSAELDVNNYATIYIYDDEGNLTKVKRETERGISTIREGRSNTVIK